jgi:hypothetical protein
MRCCYNSATCQPSERLALGTKMSRKVALVDQFLPPSFIYLLNYPCLGPFYVAQAGLKLEILLFQSPKCWD